MTASAYILLIFFGAITLANSIGFRNIYQDHMGERKATFLETKEPNLCDNTVKSYSGYFSAGGDKEYFYWFFESRNKPSKDPIMMWLSGGPGCSSTLALLIENGPCYVNSDGTDTIRSKTSWTDKANVIWVDQPPKTGFSTGTPDTNEDMIAEDMYAFLQNFMAAFPNYFENGFYVSGESYAGHYIPAIAHYIYEQNNNPSIYDTKIPLVALAIGNGLTVPYTQFASGPEMAYDSGTAPSVISKDLYLEMKSNVPKCQQLIQKCNDKYPDGHGDKTCIDAIDFCESMLIDPVADTGVNIYNLAQECNIPPLCINITNIETWLNTPEIQNKLGVNTYIQWETCKSDVGNLLVTDMVIQYSDKLPMLLENDIRVLIYNGDLDFICNWIGNEAWVRGLQWKGKHKFNGDDAVSKWKPDSDDSDDNDDNETRGILRSAKGLQLLQFFDAGHLVPTDQPQIALQMINEFLNGGLKHTHSSSSSSSSSSSDSDDYLIYI